MKQRFKKLSISLLASSVILGGLLVGGSPASAIEGLIEEPVEGLSNSSELRLQEELRTASQTQSREEIQELFESGVPADFLVDTSGDEWELIAGIKKETILQRYGFDVPTA